MAKLTQRLDDEELVLGVDAGKAVRVGDHLAVVAAEGRRGCVASSEGGEIRGARDVVAHAELARRLARDRLVVTRDHLDGDTLHHRITDRRLRVRPRGVEEGEHPDHLHHAALILLGDREGTDTTLRKVVHLGLERRADRRVVGPVDQGEQHVWRALDHFKLGAIRAPKGRLGALALRIKRNKVELHVLVAVLAVELVRREHESVESILRRLLPPNR